MYYNLRIIRRIFRFKFEKINKKVRKIVKKYFNKDLITTYD